MEVARFITSSKTSHVPNNSTTSIGTAIAETFLLRARHVLTEADEDDLSSRMVSSKHQYLMAYVIYLFLQKKRSKRNEGKRKNSKFTISVTFPKLIRPSLYSCVGVLTSALGNLRLGFSLSELQATTFYD